MQVDQSILDPKKTLVSVVQALRHRLSPEDNFQYKYILIPDSGAADTAIPIEHKLGKIPQFYIANLDKAGIVYDSNRAGWTTTDMEVKCSSANAALVIVIF